jgi:xanthine dehydrogenase accessory factor
MRQILAQLLYEREKHNDTVLVTLIGDRGSAPRGAGSQMLISRKGRAVGTIGGGAVEKHSEEMAMELLKSRQSKIHEFALHRNPGEDIGMVCGGDVTVHFQFIPAADPVWDTVISKAVDWLNAHKKGWMILREDGGAPSLAGLDGEMEGAELKEPERALLCRENCARVGGYFSMPLPVGNRAILFGGGHISQVLCPLLKSVDFRPVVFDCRPEYATEELFPEAETVICGEFTKISDYLTITDEDYLVVMTNGHSHDFEVEEQALRGEFAYLGVIGSKAKTAAVNRMLMEKGIPEERLKDVHTPVGTPIRAVTPAEIAVSIAGEMIYERAVAREGKNPPHHGCPMH